MLYFCIPLRSKKTSNNWSNVERLFNRTLNSILKQKDNEFKVFIACHDIPNTELQKDSRVKFIKVTYPVPQNTEEQMIDKYYKKRFLMQEVYKNGGGEVMFVDADDIISNNISKYINDNKEKNVDLWIINKGYEYYEDKKMIKKCPKFYNVCGSCAILNLKTNELPEKVEFEGYIRNNKYIFDYGHTKWNEIIRSRSGSIKNIPFRAVMYTINTGENHSQLTNNIGNKRKIIRCLTRFRKLDIRKREEFSIF